jgi:hypothetical protein
MSQAYALTTGVEATGKRWFKIVANLPVSPLQMKMCGYYFSEKNDVKAFKP